MGNSFIVSLEGIGKILETSESFFSMSFCPAAFLDKFFQLDKAHNFFNCTMRF